MAELEIEQIPNKMMYRIKHPGVGGSLPNDLKGHFTKPEEAEKAIRAFQSKVHSRAKKTRSSKRGNSTESTAGS